MATVRNRIVLAASLVVLGWSPCALALNPALDVSQYAHTAWRVGEGVLQRPVFSIAQTPDGYLWLATDAGLLRFDGIRSVPWQPPANQRLPSNRIIWLVSARDGTLWIGTDKGLASWKAGRLNQYSELAGFTVNKLIEDHDGVIWATVGNFATRKWVLCSIRNGRVERYGEDGGPGAGAVDIYEDTKGNLWVGTIGTALEGANGLWRWRPGAPKFYRLPPKLDGIQGLSEDDDGALLISEVGGIMRLGDGGEAVIRYPFPPSPRQPPIRLLRDRDGGLWIGSSSAGLAHMHQGIRDVFAQSDGLSGDAVSTVFEDGEGDIWVATLGGLDRFHDLTAATFSVRQGFSNSVVSSLLASRDGTIWVGTNDGLNKWDDGQVTVFRERATGTPAGPAQQQGSRTVREINGPELPGSGVQSIFEDARGRVWLSTVRGVGYLQNGHFISVPNLPRGLTRAISEDRQSNIWVANQEFGLFRVPSYAADITRIPWANLNHSDAPTAMISDSSRDGLWLGFVGGGIVHFEDGRITSSYTARDGLGEGAVRGFHFDRDAALWAAADGGLSRLKNGRVITLTSKKGLPCDAVQWLLEDDAESFWLSTACGLVRVARTEMDAWAAAAERETDVKPIVQATVFDVADGVRAYYSFGAYTSPAAVKSIDGKVWFLSQGGVSVVDPRHLPFNKLPPPVHIEQITADRKTYDAMSEANGQVRLPPLIRDLQIDYTALSLVAPEKMRFRCKLEGFDRDWQEPGTRRQAFYTNLPPRNYRFRVAASNNSGVWNEAGASLDFAIAPAYYQTRWFDALVVGTCLTLLWAAYQYRVRRIAREFDMRLEERVNERTRVARDLHDTLLQSFHGALFRFQAATNMLPERPAEAKQTFESAIDRAAQAITEGRDAIQDLRASTVVTNDLAVAITTLGDELATSGASGNSTVVHVAVEGTSRDLHPILRDDIYRIAGEALRNAFRHAHADRIEVEITYHGRQFRLQVRDDGKGIDAAVQADERRGHFGLPGMRERAELVGGRLDVWSEVGVGTEVDLTIPAAKAYVAAHRRRAGWVTKKTGRDA